MITNIVQYIGDKVTVIQIALLLTSWMPYKSVACQRIKKKKVQIMFVKTINLDVKVLSKSRWMHIVFD